MLKDGVSGRGSVQGPMAEVVARSTQYLSDDDLQAMAAYLCALPAAGDKGTPATERATPEVPSARGAKLYETHCAACHGERGEGVAGAYPALAGNRAIALTPPSNLVHIVVRGGFPPTTAGNPRPFGMPPFANVLSDRDVADLLSFVRASWGQRACAGIDARREPLPRRRAALKNRASAQNGMSSSMSLKPDVDLAAGRFAAAAAGRAAGAGRS